jgi:thermostable 8-oxoguanine DNA glycosylase
MLKTHKNIINETNFWDSFNKSNEKMPGINQEVMPGIRWGCFGKLYTPAYWKIQYLLHNQNEHYLIKYKIGDNLLEEVIACLLGGFGLKSEIGLAAFDRLRKRKQIIEGIDYNSINNSLKEPFIKGGNKIYYRFYNQKAKFITEFLNRTDLNRIPLHNDLAFREWLMSISGIGPKTASWITRNFLNSENVAIIDIHIFRAGLIAGIFSNKLKVQKDYFKIEEIFIQFCQAMNVQPSKMDALIWLQMKESNRTALKAINNL